MIQIYLLINAASYLGFSLWCLFRTDTAAKALGYHFLDHSGRVEYLSVYTGMEFGFAVFFAVSAFFPAFRMGGLLFASCLYLGLMVLRPVSAMHYGNVSKITYMIGALEWALGIWGIILLVTELKKLNGI